MTDTILSENLTLRHELHPGDLGRLISLHAEIYDQWPDYGLEFEAFVARTIAEFVLDNSFNGRVWLLECGTELRGCSAIAHRRDGWAQLRWVLLHQDLWGRGLGRQLVEIALDYCRLSGVHKVYLETTDGLDASTALYRKLGFRQVSSEVMPLWAGPRPLIRMEMLLG